MQHAVRQFRTRICTQYAFRSWSSSGVEIRQRNYSTEAKPGLMGSLRKAYDTAVLSREEQSKEKIFHTQLKYLSSKTPFTPQVFLKLLEDVKVLAGLGGMKKHLPWVSNNEAMKDFEQQEAIIKALTPAEQQSSRPVPISTKKRAARATGADLLTVESLLSHVSQMRSVQRYLLRRADRGENLPQSAEELKIMMMGAGSRGRIKMPNPGVKQRKSVPPW